MLTTDVNSQTDPDEIETVVVPKKQPSSAGPLQTSQPKRERFEPGALLASRYRIVSKLGKGGMGEVFRADDLILGQTVALKFLPESAKQDTNLLTRFYDEVRIARQISHKNVCRVYDIGEIEGQLYLTMEYIDGEDLGALLRRIGRLPSDKALEFTRKLCAAVAAAHAQGVLHRDLKPANIMIDAVGEPRITDFGLAAVAGQVSGAEVRNGTPAYMAPEQLTGREVSIQSDIYALGLVLYEMFTGKQPHQANSIAEMARLRQESRVSSPSTHIHDMDPVVEKAILHCLEPDPRDRPSSALALAASLPGGDPLAAALAAGETPSPELVAASGSADAMSPKVVVGVMAAIFACLVTLAFLVPSFHLVNESPHEFPPEVLTAKARDILRGLGYTSTPVDFYSGFYREQGMVGDLQKRKPKDWSAVMAAPPSVMVYYYRDSPTSLGDLRGVSARTPPLDTPGMSLVELDASGRLRSFRAIPPQKEPDPPQTRPDWDKLFAAAGLNRSEFTPANPEWAPLMPTQERAAWVGTYPGELKLPIRVEAAYFHGKPVFFMIVWPWSKPVREISKQPETIRQKIGEYFLVFLIVGVFAASLIMARYNWKAGRGDHRGAVKVGIAIALLEIVQHVLGMHHTFSSLAADEFQRSLAEACLSFAVYWLFYITLEPWVRRIWPRTMVSWSRLIAGKWNDPWVGRDVMFGILLGLQYCVLIQAYELILIRRGEVAFGDVSNNAFSGFNLIASDIVGQARGSLTNALIFFLVLFFAKAIFRKEWVAAICFVGLFAGSKLANSDLSSQGLIISVFWIIIYGLIVFTMLRFGVFALMVTVFTINSFVELYFTHDFAAWYGTSSWVMLVLLFGLATLGANLAVGNKPFFSASPESS